jgi:hypothetical protein
MVQPQQVLNPTLLSAMYPLLLEMSNCGSLHVINKRDIRPNQVIHQNWRPTVHMTWRIRGACREVEVAAKYHFLKQQFEISIIRG